MKNETFGGTISSASVSGTEFDAAETIQAPQQGVNTVLVDLVRNNVDNALDIESLVDKLTFDLVGANSQEAIAGDDEKQPSEPALLHYIGRRLTDSEHTQARTIRKLNALITEIFGTQHHIS